MLSEYSIRRSVEFVETDMAGIMHFSNFFRWMESCETAFYRSLDLPQISFVPGQIVGWPRVNVSCDYRAPLRFGDTAEVRLLVKEVRTRALVLGFQFRRCDAQGVPQGPVVAQGEMTAVCVTGGPDGAMRSQPIPEAFRAKVAAAPVSAWAE